MNTKEKLINSIIELYNKENQKNPNKVDLTQPAKNIKDPFFNDFKKEIEEATGRYTEEAVQEKSKNMTETIEELAADEAVDDPSVINKLGSIEEKVSALLNLLNMSLYRYRKEDLKNLIIHDMFSNFFEKEIDERQREMIIELITNMVDHEFREYESKKEQKRADLLNHILNNIMPEINNFLEENSKRSLETLTIVQRESIIKYFLVLIENKYLKSEKKIKNISDEDYLYIKKKIKDYIINRLRQQYEIIKESY